MAYESWMYGDPEFVALRKEAERLRKDAACGECVHKRSIEINREVHNACEFKRRVYGKRCELFKRDQSVFYFEDSCK